MVAFHRPTLAKAIFDGTKGLFGGEVLKLRATLHLWRGGI